MNNLKGWEARTLLEDLYWCTQTSVSTWTLLCAMVCGHFGTGGGIPKVFTKLGAKDFSKCCYSEAFKVSFIRSKWTSPSYEKQPHTRALPSTVNLPTSNQRLMLFVSFCILKLWNALGSSVTETHSWSYPYTGFELVCRPHAIKDSETWNLQYIHYLCK